MDSYKCSLNDLIRIRDRVINASLFILIRLEDLTCEDPQEGQSRRVQANQGAESPHQE